MNSKRYMKKYHSDVEPMWGIIIKILACLAITGVFLLGALL